MDGELQAAADIATGAVIAKAVEPDNGSSAAATNDDSCLNCGATITGNFCGTCGQKRKVHRTLSAFGHDIAHSVLHFDGKIWRTLPLLVWRPGDLTRRYIHGERAKFVSPLALFLFTVFLTFALFNTVIPKVNGGTKPLSAEAASKRLETDRKDLQDEIAKLEAEKAEAIRDNLPSGWIDKEIERDREELGKLETETQAAAVSARRFAVLKRRNESAIARLESQLATAKAAGRPTASLVEELESERLSLKLLIAASGVADNRSEVTGKWTFTDLDFPGAAQLNASVQQAVENPQLLLYKVQSNAYKFSWALIPISVPFVWLLFFWRRQFKMFDHAVFVTYSLCFMMVGLSIAAALINGETYEVAGGLLLAFAPPIHMYRQLRQAYGLTRLGAFIRMLLLLSFAGVALILFGLMIIALGVTG
jgi:Protein of unknown function (DUF3667)